MSKTIRFVKGGTLGANGKPLLWEISKEPGLSKELYVFVPGVPVEVSDSDAAWFLDPANTRGRVFEAVKGAPAPGPTNPVTPLPPPPMSTSSAPVTDTLPAGSSPEASGRDKHQANATSPGGR